MTDFADMTAHGLLDLLAKGDCSSEDAVRGVVDLIDARDGELGAYLSIDAEDALSQARAADKARAEGETGRLLGVPVAVKDIINVNGQSCRCAAVTNMNYVCCKKS